MQNTLSKFFENISNEVANIGYWCSILVVVYTVLKILHRIYAVCTLRFKKQVPLGQAISLAFFLEGRMRNTLANFEESRQEVYDEVPRHMTARDLNLDEVHIPMVPVPSPPTVPPTSAVTTSSSTAMVPYAGSAASTSRHSRYWS